MARFPRRNGRQLVRLHLEGADPSIEGVLVGHAGGCYFLANAKLIGGPSESIPLEGRIEVPERRVLFAQLLGEGAR
jgi:hypothetical protein